jgi:hypothetical protein
MVDPKTGRKVCELIAGIIATDKELHPSELQFMLRTFAAFGVARGDEDEALCPTVTAVEAERQMGELPEDVQQEALRLLVSSAVVDGKVTPAERDWLVAVARAAGVSGEAVDERIAAALLEGDANA